MVYADCVYVENRTKGYRSLWVVAVIVSVFGEDRIRNPESLGRGETCGIYYILESDRIRAFCSPAYMGLFDRIKELP